MFAGTYLNLYTPNGAVVMPAFGDTEAERAVRTAFPEREINVLRIDLLASGGGGMRCLVQPVGKPKNKG